MSLSMPPSAASSSLRQAGRVQKHKAPDHRQATFRNTRHQTATVGAERNAASERRDDDAKDKRDSPARKRSISGSGDDAA